MKIANDTLQTEEASESQAHMRNRNISVLPLCVVQCCCGWYPTVDKFLDSFWQLCCYVDNLVSHLASDSADRYVAFQNSLSWSM